MTHTKGNWYINSNKENNHIYCKDELICEKPTSKANAQLIASAPDLLLSCRERIN